MSDIAKMIAVAKAVGGSGGSSSSGGAQADWNAQEGEPGHVLNRTHWAEEGIGYLLENSMLVGTEHQLMTADEVNGTLEAGETYTIIWNDTEYECVAQEMTEEGLTLPVIGNMGLMGGTDTGEPFIMLFVPPEMKESMGGATVVAMINYDVEGALVSVLGKTEVAHELPQKFVKTAIANLTINCLKFVPGTSFGVGEILYVCEWWPDGTPVIKGQRYGELLNQTITTKSPLSEGHGILYFNVKEERLIESDTVFLMADDLYNANAIVLKSSTEGSDKRFKITVDDNGTISATEYTD